ncbi:MAG TPA: family 43 glycosylhydrolase [Ruminococcus sp.]|nr:family 43 glycosylhydrolase [Ruminococcus sp.]
MRKSISSKAATLIMSATVFLSSLPLSASAESISMTNAVKTLETCITIPADQISSGNYKDTRFNNPISPDFFCADPTAVEYNGRLYVYGTNDHQQFEAAGPDVDNTYEKIKSLLVFSTADMVNWTYHGEINVGEIAPWITASWAPSIVSRKEADGKTHFYLYFSNSGVGTGVITSTDPVTGWTDPLGHCLVTGDTPGLSDCPNPFDPGAVIDDNGVGWIAFGAGKASGGTDYMPGSVRIVRLGEDMISFDSEFKQIPAPYSFEASELNYINGTYVYTYCSDWNDHSEQWDFDCPAPGGCGMVYMTSKTPLDPTSWKMMGECFRQPGEVGFDYSNNHTHMHKFKGKWYMFYHTLMLKHGMGITGGYRSMGVDEIEVDEENVIIEDKGGTKKGASQNGVFSPYEAHSAAELVGTAQIDYDMTDPYAPIVSAKQAGSWTAVRGVQFTESENASQPAAAELLQMNIDTIQYDLTVTSLDAPTTITMYASAQNGVKNQSSVEVTGKGKYKVTVDMNSAKGFQIVGCFTAANDTPVTMEVDSITLNGKYNIAVAAELTNTREWADGLRNIWNGFSDGDAVYTDDYAVLKYVKADDAIELFAAENSANTNNAPLVEKPISFAASVKGKGSIDVHLDAPTGGLLTSIAFDSPSSFTTVYSDPISNIGGTHDLYFVYSDQGVSMQSWRFTESSESSDRLMGDVNMDGNFDIADVVLLQKWLLAVPDTKLTDWKAADLCEDNRLDVFDLCLMRRKLIYG